MSTEQESAAPSASPGLLEGKLREKAIEDLTVEVDRLLAPIRLLLQGVSDTKLFPHLDKRSWFEKAVRVEEGTATMLDIHWPAMLAELKRAILRYVGKTRGDEAIKAFIDKVNALHDSVEELRSNAGL